MLSHPIYGRYLLSVYAPSILNSLGQMATMILLPLYVLDLGGSVAEASIVAAARGTGMLVMDVPAGFIAGRLGPRKTMLISVVSSIAASLILVMADGIPLIGFSNLLFGVSASLLMVSRQTYVTASSPRYERGRVIAVMAACFRVAALLGPVLGGAGAELLGYRTVFALTVLTSASSLLLIWLFTENIAASEPTDDDQPGSALTRLARVARANRAVLASAGYTFLAMMVLRYGRSLLVPLFGHELGLGVASIGLIVSTAALVDLSMFYPAGRIMDARGRRFTAIPSILVISLGTALLPLSASFMSLLLIAMIMGLGNGIGTGVFLTIGSDIAPDAQRSEFLGMWRMIGDAGGLISPLLIGTIAAAATLPAATAVVAAVGFSGLAVMITRVPETLTRNQGSGIGNQ